MNIVVDGGNTRIKLAHFEKENIQAEHSFTELKKFSDYLNTLPAAVPIISSNVGHWEWQEAFDRFQNHLELTPQTPLPIELNYTTPQTLGNDRRALAVAAACEFKNQAVLVIDAGTCITYDFVDESGTYQGGGIGPGLQMRFKSLHNFTARLPLIKFNTYTRQPQLVGNSTENSILSGVVNGFTAEVEKTIENYKHRLPHIQIVLTGGDAQLLAHLTKNGIFARPKFLLTGLYYILGHHA